MAKVMTDNKVKTMVSTRSPAPGKTVQLYGTPSMRWYWKRYLTLKEKSFSLIKISVFKDIAKCSSGTIESMRLRR